MVEVWICCQTELSHYLSPCWLMVSKTHRNMGYKWKKTQHNSDITWLTWRFRSLATWLFLQQLVQAYYKENSQQSFVLLGLCDRGESTSDQCIPLTNGQWCRKYFQTLISSWWQTFFSRLEWVKCLGTSGAPAIGVLVHMSECPINEIIMSGGSRPCSWPPDVLGATLVAGSGTPPAPVLATSPTGHQAEWRG